MNYEAILIRYAEIHLKGKNKHYFEKVLKTNINAKLKKYETQLESVSGRYIITNFKQSDLKQILNRLSKTAGVYSISPAYVCNAEVNEIRNLAECVMADKFGTFRVTTTRADKNFPVPSMEFSASLGGVILRSNKDLKVDLHNPDTNLQIDIRQNGKAYVFFEEIMGVSGMPVSTSGNGLLLLSGGIDSPVAGYMMIKRGLKLSCLHFESFPYTSPQAKQKALDLAKVLTEYNGPTKVYVANISKIQEEIHEHCHPDFMITLVRRFMLRIAQRLAEQKNLSSFVSGESLAQVASQTIESISTISSVLTTNKPFFKPLIGFDKQETVELAKKIETFDISIRPYDDCCTVFLPSSPVIKPKLEKVLELEKRIDVVGLVDEVMANIEEIFVE